MSSPLSSDIPKPFGSTEKLAKDVNKAVALPVPAFGDLSKAANDVRIANVFRQVIGPCADDLQSSSTRTSTTPPRVSMRTQVDQKTAMAY